MAADDGPAPRPPPQAKARASRRRGGTRWLVTGSSGFLGSQIAARLAGRADAELACLDVLPPAERYPGVLYLQQDIRDLPRLLEATRDVDIIVHTAALVPLTKSGRTFFEVNAGGTENVVTCCRRNGVGRLVHLSSSAIYGLPGDHPIRDDSPAAPLEIYGRSKLAAEQAVRRYLEAGGSAACIRPRTIVGGKHRLGIFQILFEWIFQQRDIYVIGRGDNQFQFLHLDDLLEAIFLAAAGRACGMYNVGSRNYGTLRNTLEGLIDYANSSSRVRGLPVVLARGALRLADLLRLSPLAPWHYLTYHKPFVFDISRAVTELGWEPRYSDGEAFAQSYDWYRENRESDPGARGSAHRSKPKQRLLRVLKWFS
jgi:nucleoside-diphosphate-sugar epimerase